MGVPTLWQDSNASEEAATGGKTITTCSNISHISAHRTAGEPYRSNREFER